MLKRLKLYYRKCPSCGSNNYSLFYNHKNFEKIDSLGKKYLIDKFYVICRKCNLVYTNPTVRPSEYDKIYENTIIGSFRNIKNSKSNLKKLNYFCELVSKKIIKNKTILDIGCGQGELLKNIKKKFKIPPKKIFAIEPSKKIYNYLKKNTSINVRNMFLDGLKNNEKYDFLILDNVFEHFDYPKKSLQKINNILTDNGYVYISIPNALNPHFEYEDPLNHTCNYYKKNIKELFSKNNFKILKLVERDTLINFLAIKQQVKFTNTQYREDKKKFYLLKEKIKKNKIKIKKQSELIKKTGINIKKKNMKVIVFGSGNYSLELLKKLNINKQVLGYIDSNPIYHGSIRNGYKVFSIEQLDNFNFDKIIIASNKFKFEIYSLLLKKKVKHNKIILFK